MHYVTISLARGFFFSSRRRHTRWTGDWSQTCALPICPIFRDTLAELKENLRLYPDEVLAAQVNYPQEYLEKWDAETQTRRLTGVAANDCHHNQILVVKMVDETTVLIGTNVDEDKNMRRVTAGTAPSIRELT